jgi:hypothetical protein
MIDTQDNIKVTYRDVAKLLCSNIPDSDYSAVVNTTLETVKSLPEQTKLAMRIAYIFAAKVPHDERLDCFQSFTATLIEHGTNEPKLAYSITMNNWRNWWRAYKIHAYTDLDATIENDDSDDATTLGDLLIGEIEFSNRIESDDSADRLWLKVPADIKPLILKRMQAREPIVESTHGKVTTLKRGRPMSGAALTSTERSQLNRWIAKDGYKLVLN